MPEGEEVESQGNAFCQASVKPWHSTKAQICFRCAVAHFFSIMFSFILHRLWFFWQIDLSTSRRFESRHAE